MSTHTKKASAKAPNTLYFSIWRWHFYAGLYVIPFIIMLSITGLTMMWSNAYAPFGFSGSLTPQDTQLSAEAQMAAVQSIYPDAVLKKYITADAIDLPAYVQIATDETNLAVAIDPYTGDILGAHNPTQSVYAWANDIHGTLLIGNTGDILIEIAAGFAIILVVTGLYLTWPRNGQSWQMALFPKLSGRGRTWWKRLHGTIGFYGGIFLILFLLTGLSWTGVWGSQLTQAWSTFPADKWGAPQSELVHKNLNTGPLDEVPWALEQTPLPASGGKTGIAAIHSADGVTLDEVITLAESYGMAGRFTIALPQDETGVYSVSEDSMSGDSPSPFSDQFIHIDQYTGNVLASATFAEYSVGGKAMAAGVALHEGKAGLLSLIANTLLCLMFVFISISGAVMWWKRRPKGLGRLAAPPVPQGKKWHIALFFIVALSFVFPLTGATLIGVLLIDLLLIRFLPAVKKRIR